MECLHGVVEREECLPNLSFHGCCAHELLNRYGCVDIPKDWKGVHAQTLERSPP